MEQNLPWRRQPITICMEQPFSFSLVQLDSFCTLQPDPTLVYSEVKAIWFSWANSQTEEFMRLKPWWANQSWKKLTNLSSCPFHQLQHHCCRIRNCPLKLWGVGEMPGENSDPLIATYVAIFNLKLYNYPAVTATHVLLQSLQHMCYCP